MRKGFLRALGALLTGAGLASATTPTFQPAVSVPYPAAFGGPSAPPVQMMPAQGVPYGYPGGAAYQPAWTPAPQSAVRVFTTPNQPPPPPPTLPAPEKKPASEPTSPKEPLPPATISDGSVPTPIGPSSSLPYPQIAAAVFADDGRPAILPYEGHHDCKCWLALDYLYWIVRRDDIPANLVTNGPPANNQLLGGTIEHEWQHGVRLQLGKWLCTDFALEVGGFSLIQDFRNITFTSDAAGNPQFARPFINADNGVPDVGLATSPGLFAGSIDVRTNTLLWGLDANLLANVGRCECLAVNLIAGARYLHLSEGIDITQTGTPLSDAGAAFFLGTQVPTGQPVFIRDAFDANNDFFGGQFGVQFGLLCDKWFLGMTGKVAGGIIYETVDVRGTSSTVAADGTVQNTAGGLLAVNSNRTRHTSSVVAVIPEAEFSVGYQITPRLTATIGYNFLYVSRVVRPGPQMSTFVSSSQIPVSQSFTGPTLTQFPRPPFDDGVFWAQGVSASLAFRF